MPNCDIADGEESRTVDIGGAFSVKIRRLFNFWIRLRGDRIFPAWPDINLMDVYDLAPHVAVLDVEGADRDTAQFRFRFCGTALVDARVNLKPGDPTGSLLHEIEWPFDPEPLVLACIQVVTSGMPAILTSDDVAEDPFVRYERAFFPLGTADQGVTQILGCIDRAPAVDSPT